MNSWTKNKFAKIIKKIFYCIINNNDAAKILIEIQFRLSKFVIRKLIKVQAAANSFWNIGGRKKIFINFLRGITSLHLKEGKKVARNSKRK